MTTFIFGHVKPDTDAVVAAMALEYLYKNSDLNQVFANPEAVLVSELNPETTFLFKKFGLSAPRVLTAGEIANDDQVVLVDHNEASQRLAGLNQDQIVNIVDHHKINLDLTNPIHLTFRPWGSSCTLVYHLMKNENVVPDKTTASLMVAAILSDTVGYKSATTTPEDLKLGGELAKLAGMTDVDAFTLEIFKAKSDVSQLTDEQIVTNDYKIFDFGGKKVLIDQIETVEQDLVLTQKKAGLLKAMTAIKAKEAVDYIFVVITDVLKVNSKVLVLDDKSAQIAIAGFGGLVVNQILDIGPRMSRKKEIAPVIEKVLALEK